MKRLTPRRRRWFAHRHRTEARRRRRREGYALISVIGPTGTWTAKVGRKPINLPEVLCFDQNPTATLEALADLKRALQTPTGGGLKQGSPSKHRAGRQSWLGRYRAFETLRHITPAAALVLASEYDRLRRSSGNKPFVANIENWSPEVFETIRDIGFFDIVGFTGTIDEADLKADVAVLTMRSGDTTDSAEISQLVDGLKQLYPDPDEHSGAGLVHLYGAMVEAIGNVVSHAYPNGSTVTPRSVQRWWMTGAVDRKLRQTTAVVYDRGITIPVSLPSWDRYDGWLRRMTRKLGIVAAASDPRSDGDAIAAAVEEAISSTGATHRGTGLAQMRNFVDQCRGGRLRIMSRCGEVVFRPRQQPDIKTYEISVGGTLIEWNVFL